MWHPGTGCGRVQPPDQDPPGAAALSPPQDKAQVLQDVRSIISEQLGQELEKVRGAPGSARRAAAAARAAACGGCMRRRRARRQRLVPRPQAATPAAYPP